MHVRGVDGEALRNTSPGGGSSALALLALTAGATVANIYLLQPLLAIVAREFATTPRAVGVVSMLTQVGYGSGMFFFVPLGDVLERRRLMLVLLGAATVALLAAAAAPSLPLLALASLAIGVTSVVPQLAVPLAAHLAPPAERGRAVGTVMGGLLVGILLARTASGFPGRPPGMARRVLHRRRPHARPRGRLARIPAAEPPRSPCPTPPSSAPSSRSSPRSRC